MSSVSFKYNIVIFIILSVLSTVISVKMPVSCFNYKKWQFKMRTFEKNGDIYQHFFKVKRWKNHIPELGDFVKSIFPKKQILKLSRDYLYRFAAETCRAEFAHWCIIFSSFIFRFWNDAAMSIFMVLLAIALNFPYIIIQRYNRPRIINILAQKNLLKTEDSMNDQLNMLC